MYKQPTIDETLVSQPDGRASPDKTLASLLARGSRVVCELVRHLSGKGATVLVTNRPSQDASGKDVDFTDAVFSLFVRSSIGTSIRK